MRICGFLHATGYLKQQHTLSCAWYPLKMSQSGGGTNICTLCGPDPAPACDNIYSIYHGKHWVLLLSMKQIQQWVGLEYLFSETKSILRRKDATKRPHFDFRLAGYYLPWTLEGLYPPFCIVTGELEHSIWNKRLKHKTFVCVYVHISINDISVSLGLTTRQTLSRISLPCAGSTLPHSALQPFHPGAVTCCVSSWHQIHWVLSCSERASPPRIPGAIVLNLSSLRQQFATTLPCTQGCQRCGAKEEAPPLPLPVSLISHGHYTLIAFQISK